MTNNLPDTRKQRLKVLVRGSDLSGLENGAVYSNELFLEENSRRVMQLIDFVSKDGTLEVASLDSDIGPGELIQRLGREFDVTGASWYGRVLGYFHVAPEQSGRLIEDLKNNKQKYQASE